MKQFVITSKITFCSLIAFFSLDPFNKPARIEFSIEPCKQIALFHRDHGVDVLRRLATIEYLSHNAKHHLPLVQTLERLSGDGDVVLSIVFRVSLYLLRLFLFPNSDLIICHLRERNNRLNIQQHLGIMGVWRDTHALDVEARVV